MSNYFVNCEQFVKIVGTFGFLKSHSLHKLAKRLIHRIKWPYISENIAVFFVIEWPKITSRCC